MSMDDIHREVLRVFADACTPRTPRPLGQRGFCPPADVFYEEADDSIVVRFELPGLERDDIDLLVDRRQLAVRGERSFPVADGRTYQQVELDYGPFERRIRLGLDVDPDQTTATYDHGILEVRLRLAQLEHTVSHIQIECQDESEHDA